MLAMETLKMITVVATLRTLVFMLRCNTHISLKLQFP